MSPDAATAPPHLRFLSEALEDFGRRCIQAVGAHPEAADVFARGLVIADLRGIESHGVARLDAYVRLVEQGLMDATARPAIVREAPATALVEANNGLGHVASDFAMRLAIQKARDTGMGWVSVTHSNHFGIAGYWAGMALEHRMIGFAGTNAGPGVAPTYGRTRMLGTNPLAVAAPTRSERPFLLDMATSSVAAGKPQIASWEGRSVPGGWGIDADGAVTTDPDVMLRSGALLPLGSFPELSSHKGYGLAVMVQILSAVLGGGPYDHDVRNLTLGTAARPTGVSHFFGALDVARFGDPEDFVSRLDGLICALHGAPRQGGQERIYVAGEKEWEKEEAYRAQGIPVHEAILERLRVLADRLHIAAPEPIAGQ